ncbi:Cytokinin hydroxylase [Platanthera zijinensis]|uniref:Cytokinin hydroxylase n=1 Tax=Platanthera zijinensis TaxID=2320716 RepID=A0AAP0BU85_9ASPA
METKPMHGRGANHSKGKFNSDNFTLNETRGWEIGRSWLYKRGLLGMLLVKTQKKDALSYNLQLMMDECKTFASHETLGLGPFSSV